ncbi:MAG: hypothetical protein ACK526_11620 [Planctomyces sp.]
MAAAALIRICLSVLIGVVWAGSEASAFAEAAQKANDSKTAGFPADAMLVPELSQPEMEVRTSESKLYFRFRSLPEKNELRVPRLGNSVRAIHWLSMASKDMALKPEIETWIITLPERTSDSGGLLVIELDGPVTLMTTPPVEKPDDDGVITLPASHGVTRGKNLRYEPQPHKNTIGYWSMEADTVEWKFSTSDATTDATTFEIDVLQGCGKGHGGSKVSVVLNDQSAAEFDVRETGHFQNFIWRTVGSVSLKPDAEQTLRIVPLRKISGAVMDVRAVRLVPKNSKAPRPMIPELADPAALPAGL